MSNVEPWNIATELTSPAGTERIHAQGAEPNDYYVTTSTLAAYAQTGMATDAEVATAVSDHAAASDPHGDRAHAAGLVSTHSADTTSVHGITDTSALLDTGDIGTTVQGYSAVLAATTASFTTADETKLDGIEAGADVTDATNVAAAGAVMASLVDAKGDLIVATAADAVARLPVGATNGHVLTVDSAEATGVKWAAASGGGASMARQPLLNLTPSGGVYYSGVPGVTMRDAGAGVALTANTAYYSPMVVTGDSITLATAELRVTAAGTSGGLARIAVYAADGNWQPDARQVDAGTVAVDSTGRKAITGLSTVLAPGYYLVRVHPSVNCTIEAHYGSCPEWSMHPVGQNHPLVYTSVPLTFGAAETPGTDATAMYHNNTGTYSWVTFTWGD